MGIGSVGLSDAPAIPSDLEAIYQGGQFFLDRMKAMSDAKTAADASLVALAIGNDVAAARTKAAATLDAANKTNDAANQALADAQSQAAKIISDAKAQAEDIVNAAVSAVSVVTGAVSAGM